MAQPFNVTFSKDKMQCFLQVFFTGEPLDIHTILNILNYNHITIGIDTNSIQKAIRDSFTDKKDIGPVIIAQGISPRVNKAQCIEFYVQFPDQRLKENIANNFISPQIYSAKTVKKGDIIALKKTLKDSSIAGLNIFGNLVEPAVLDPDENVIISKKNQYIADEDGYVVIDDGIISIMPPKELTIKVKVSNDRLKADVIIEKKEFEEIIPSLESVINAMKKNWVEYGYDHKTIKEELLKLNLEQTRFPVIFTGARGEPKIEEKDALLNLFFAIDPDKTDIPLSLVTSPEKDKTDNVFKHNEKIAELIKADKGKPGHYVTGEILNPKKPKDIILTHDSYISAADNNETGTTDYFMETGGKVELRGNIIMVHPYQDASMELKISDDKLTCTADFYPALGGGQQLDIEICKKELLSKNIIYNILEKNISTALSRLLKTERPLKNIILVQGAPPIKGDDGYLNCYFKPQKMKPAIDEFGNVNHYELGLIPFIEKDKIIAEIIPPTPGSSGKNIFNETIPPQPGESIEITAGENVYTSEDKRTFMAKAEGSPKIENEIIKIIEVIQINQDINFATGNILYKGDIIIEGDVQSGFSVESQEGEVQIKGGVYDALIKAKKGIKIGNGIIGKQRCFLSTEGDLIAKFIENAIIEVQGNIEVANYILNSTITAGNSLIVTRGKGLILGGQTFASQEIEVNNLSNEIGTKTYLYVGQRYDLINKIAAINEKSNDLNEKLKNVNKLTDSILTSDNKELPELKKQLSLYQIKKEKITGDLQSYQNILQELYLAINKERGKLEGTITIRGKSYPGAYMVIKNKEIAPKLLLQAKVIAYDNQTEQIMIKPYSYSKIKKHPLSTKERIRFK